MPVGKEDIGKIGFMIACAILLYVIVSNGISYYKSTFISKDGRYNKIKFENMMAQYLYVMIIILIIIFVVTFLADTDSAKQLSWGTTPSATVATDGAGDKAKEMAKQVANNAKAMLSAYPIIIMGCILVFSVTFWGVDKMTLDKRNCTIMQPMYDNNNTTIKSFFGVTTNETNNFLYNYYIKTAYNCCCGGNYKNDYVNTCALESCIKAGVRCLDFEIYSVNNQPVIAASSVDNFTIKETYNVIPFKEAMDIIRDKAFSESNCPCSKDPLFLNFRIKSKHQNIYNQMALDLLNTLAPKLLGKKYSYQYKLDNKMKNFGDVKLDELKGKVVIMVDGGGSLFAGTNLEEYINIASNSPYFKIIRFDRLNGLADEDKIKEIDYNKEHITMCLPNLSTRPKNFPCSVPQNCGCQFMAMCFQSNDSSLAYYNDYLFKKYSIVVKPLKYQRQLYLVKMPSPVDDAVNSCIQQTTSLPGGLSATFNADGSGGGGIT